MDVGAFLRQLPEDPPKGLLAWAEDTQAEELGREYTIFHNERIETPPEMQDLMDNRTTGRKVWATFCVCTACGEEWVTKRGTTPESFWVVARKSGLTNRMYYEIQYYNPEDKRIHTGYGSYNEEMVLGWLNMYFEVDREAKFRLELVPLEEI